MTSVIKVQNAPNGWKSDPRYVYIGRANGRYGLRKSKWHNPFRSKSKTVEDNLKAVDQYREYIMTQPDLLNDLHELKGKILVCWCRPELPCHGDLLVELVNELQG